MPKRAIMLLTAVSLAMPVASAAYAQDITVTAPRHRERSPTTGAPIETVTTSRVVNTADLDLRTDAGMKALRGRVEEAARKACAWLDQVYPLTADDSPPCVKTAVDKAMADAQALAAR
ncbi:MULTISPECIES: UrcA family protein [Sphingomonas]|nr:MULTISPECIES: UrcA family protein [Sphingomonas]AGH50914.1 hypothetical protein G432_15980 [Sphingomonas sp. MM-1]